jgi:prolyl oligopeptidase PreP (S9A serine peptidase family)
MNATPTRAWSPALAPDGTALAYVSDREGAPRVVVRHVHDGQERILDTGPASVLAVRWSVDGGWLALLAAPGGGPRTQVWVLRPDGSDLRQLGADPDGATLLGPWSHRPGLLALARTAAHGGEGATELEHVDTLERQVIAVGSHPMLLDLDRNNRLALVRRGPRGAREIWLIDLRTQSEVQLLQGLGPCSSERARLAPDARTAYVISDAGGEMRGLFAIALSEDGVPGKARMIAERAEAELDDFVLTAGGQRALLLWNLAGRSECQMMRLDAAIGDGLPTFVNIELPEPVALEPSFSRDGRWLAMTLEGPTQPQAIWICNLERSHWQPITHQADDWWRPTIRPTLEFVRTADQFQIPGWLYRAPGGEPGPAVVHLHGGPEAQERPSFNPLFQALAAAGISVFAPNVRGSSGFGRTFVNADNLDKRWDGIEDVVRCVEYLVRSGVAAAGRIACAGRSYGGYLTLAMLVFHPELFAAGVDVCGMADLQTFYAHTEPWIAVAAYPKYGHPEHDAALLHALSPIHRFDALRAPLLVVHGENDTNVPIEEADQVVAAARARGIDVQYERFAGEGHELLRRDSQAKFVEITVDWLKARL